MSAPIRGRCSGQRRRAPSSGRRTTRAGPGFRATCWMCWSANCRRFSSSRRRDYRRSSGRRCGLPRLRLGPVLERLPAARYDDLAMPDVDARPVRLGDRWDHEAGTSWLVTTGLPATGDGAGPRGRASGIEQVRDRLRHPDRPARAIAQSPGSARTGTRPRAVLSCPRRSRTRKRSASAPPLRARGYLERGAAGARVHPRRATSSRPTCRSGSRRRSAEPPLDALPAAPAREPGPVRRLSRLRRRHACSARRRSVSCSLDGRPASRPGRSRARARADSGPMHDAALGRALTESDKDRAENVMIVDLLRNDLSRVCRPGTRARAGALRARAAPDGASPGLDRGGRARRPAATRLDLLRATFPGGSITGAPKVRAMEIIAELEPTERGLYCGAIGYHQPHRRDGHEHRDPHLSSLRNGRVYFSGGRRHRRRLRPRARVPRDAGQGAGDRPNAGAAAPRDPPASTTTTPSSTTSPATSRELGETPVVRRNDAVTLDEIAALAPVAHHRLARSLLAGRGRDLDRPGPPLRRHGADPGRLPRAPGIGAAYGGEIVRATRPMHGKTSRIAPRRHRRLRGPPVAAAWPRAITRSSSRPNRCRPGWWSTPCRTMARSWACGTPRTRCTACSSIPSRCSPATGTACCPASSSVPIAPSPALPASADGGSAGEAPAGRTNADLVSRLKSRLEIRNAQPCRVGHPVPRPARPVAARGAGGFPAGIPGAAGHDPDARRGEAEHPHLYARPPGRRRCRS